MIGSAVATRYTALAVPRKGALPQSRSSATRRSVRPVLRLCLKCSAHRTCDHGHGLLAELLLIGRDDGGDLVGRGWVFRGDDGEELARLAHQRAALLVAPLACRVDDR